MSVENKQDQISLRLGVLASEVTQGSLAKVDFDVKKAYVLRLDRLVNIHPNINPPDGMTSENTRNLIIKAMIGAVNALSELGEGQTATAILQQAAENRDRYKKLPR